ncbi:MAG: HIT family protein [Promethearchaeia archaeon]
MNEEECIFCKIAKNQIPSKKIYEDEKVIGFLDIFPVSKGHTVIIPKEHFEAIDTIDTEPLIHVMKAVKKLSSLILNKLHPDGLNIVQNNYQAAGQVVKHFHIHIIPRTKNDKKIQVFTPENRATDEELDEILDILKQ